MRMPLNTDDVMDCYKRAAYENLLPADQLILAHLGVVKIKNRLAFNQGIVLKVQKLLASDLNSSVRVKLASNKNLAPKIQRLLAKDEDLLVREALRSNSFAKDPKAKKLLAV